MVSLGGKIIMNKDITHHLVGPFFVFLFVAQGIRTETFGVPFLDAIIVAIVIYHSVRLFYQFAYERGKSNRDE